MRAVEDFLPFDELEVHLEELLVASMALDHGRVRGLLALAVEE